MIDTESDFEKSLNDIQKIIKTGSTICKKGLLLLSNMNELLKDDDKNTERYKHDICKIAKSFKNDNNIHFALTNTIIKTSQGDICVHNFFPTVCGEVLLRKCIDCDKVDELHKPIKIEVRNIL